MIKIYFRIALMFLCFLALIGYILPFLFSANDSMLVFAGAILSICAIPAFCIVAKRLYKESKPYIAEMKKHTPILLVFFVIFTMTACSKVPAGNVGIKVYLLGGEKGVDSEELGVGRYWIGVNEELYLFPTFTQNYVWTRDPQEGSPNDESITFQTKEGLSVNADIGISYHIDPTRVSVIFQKYRKGIGEITDIYLRNMTRDALNQVGSNNQVEAVYGSGKTKLIDDVQALVREQCSPIGIIIEKIYLTGEMRLPQSVVAALNSKIEATQRAQQRENELREAEAQARKKVAEANGEAEAILAKATAQAKANITIAKSLTAELIKYEVIKRWDGVMPKLVGGDGVLPMIDIGTSK